MRTFISACKCGGLHGRVQGVDISQEMGRTAHMCKQLAGDTQALLYLKPCSDVEYSVKNTSKRFKRLCKHIYTYSYNMNGIKAI